MKVSYAPLMVALVVAPFAIAQKPMMKSASVGQRAMGPDKTYMTKASHSNWNEISLAKMAKQKSKNPEVLRYADLMIKDHTMMQSQLKALASSKGVMVPEKPDAMGMKAASKLRNLSGRAFDKGYIDANVMGHRAAYDLATKASKNAKDANVRAYFAKGAPKIKMHLDAAVKDQKAMMSGKPMKNHAGHGGH